MTLPPRAIPDSIYFKHGRATRFGRAVSRLSARWAAQGWPPHQLVALEVQGRKTGRTRRLAAVVAAYVGERYLVSELGEGQWVKNVRANPEASIVHGKRRSVRLEEVPVDERAPIIKEYIRVAPGSRRQIGVGDNPDLDECAAVAPYIRVYRVVGWSA